MAGTREHPLGDLVIAGEAVNPLPTAFHTLLQTIADLMLLPPPGMFYNNRHLFIISLRVLILNQKKKKNLQDLRYNTLLLNVGPLNLHRPIICFFIEVTFLVILVKFCHDRRKRRMLL